MDFLLVPAFPLRFPSQSFDQEFLVEKDQLVVGNGPVTAAVAVVVALFAIAPTLK